MTTQTLYRAADDEDISTGTSFAECEDTAREYLDNPGFGGRSIYSTEITVSDDQIVDLTGESVADVAGRCGMSDPGAIGVDEWLPRTGAAMESLRAAGYLWALVAESFPRGTTTWIWLGGVEDSEPELAEVEE